MKIVHFIVFSWFFPFWSMVVTSLSPWLLSSVYFLLRILSVLKSKLSRVLVLSLGCFIFFKYIYIYICYFTDLFKELEHSRNAVATWVLSWAFSYFLCPLFPGLMLFWFYHLNLFAGHNCRAHWSEFPGLPIGLTKIYIYDNDYTLVPWNCGWLLLKTLLFMLAVQSSCRSLVTI